MHGHFYENEGCDNRRDVEEQAKSPSKVHATALLSVAKARVATQPAPMNRLFAPFEGNGLQQFQAKIQAAYRAREILDAAAHL
jgi:hypothetical protein